LKKIKVCFLLTYPACFFIILFCLQARSKRFLQQIANLVTFHLFPVPVLPSNFIGLQVDNAEILTNHGLCSNYLLYLATFLLFPFPVLPSNLIGLQVDSSKILTNSGTCKNCNTQPPSFSFPFPVLPSNFIGLQVDSAKILTNPGTCKNCHI